MSLSQITRRFAIPALSVQASADSISRHIRQQKGIHSVVVSLKEKTMTVTYEDTVTDIRGIIQEVQACGYQANLLSQQPSYSLDSPKQETASLSYTPWVFGLIVTLSSLLPIPSILPFLLSLGIFYLLKDFLFPLDTKRLESRFFVLLEGALALLILYGFCKGDSVVMPITSFVFLPILYIYQQRLFSLPQEEIHLQKVQYANVYANHQENTKEIRSIKEDDVIILRQNEIIPADGIVLTGFALCDESVLTGNTIPVEKSAGKYLYANTRITSGSLTMRMDRIHDPSTLERFQQYSEQAILKHESASPLSFIGKELHIFLLLITALVLCGHLFQTHNWMMSTTAALSILAASCPGVFTLITRQEMVQTAKAAMNRHILYRTVEGMRDCTSKDVILLDQDGSLTESQLSILRLVPAIGTSQTKLEYIAYALSSKSDLPYAKAMTTYLRKQRIQEDTVSDFRSLSRMGAQNFKKLSNYSLLHYEEMQKRNLALPHEDFEEMQKELHQGRRIYLFTENHHYIGYAVAMKAILPQAVQNIQALQEQGYQVAFLLSGSYYEQVYLEQLLHPNAVYAVSSQEEKEHVLHDMIQKDTRFLYVSKTPVSLKESGNLMVQMDAGANIDQPDSDIILTRNQLSDLQYALAQSKICFHNIESKQIQLVIYHVIVALGFGLFFPIHFHTSAPLLLCYLCNILVIHQILRK